MKDDKNRKSSEYDYEALATWVRGRACGPCRSKDPTSIVYDAGLHKSCQRCERLADWLQGMPINERTLSDLCHWVESKKQQKSEWQAISKILLFAARGFINSGNPEINLPDDELREFNEQSPKVEVDESVLDDEDEDAGFEDEFQDDWL